MYATANEAITSTVSPEDDPRTQEIISWLNRSYLMKYTIDERSKQKMLSATEANSLTVAVDEIISTLESELYALGFYEAKPEDLVDLPIYANTDELQSNSNDRLGNSTFATPAPPNYSAWSGVYRIVCFDGTHTTGGETFEYRYIYVFDSYNRGELINTDTTVKLTKDKGTQFDFNNWVNFTISWIGSQVLSALTVTVGGKEIAVGIIADFTIGSIAAGINTGTSTFSSNEDLCSVVMSSATQMKYYYVYGPNKNKTYKEWNLIASSANINYTESYTVTYYNSAINKVEHKNSSRDIEKIGGKYYWEYINDYKAYLDSYPTNATNMPGFFRIYDVSQNKYKAPIGNVTYNAPFAGEPHQL